MPGTNFWECERIASRAYHPKGNGGVEHVNDTMAQMLAMTCNERQDGWDIHLPHVDFAYNNPVSAATGSAANEVHMNRLPRRPLTSSRTALRPRPSQPRPRPTNWNTGTPLPTANGMRMRWCVNNTLSRSLAWNAVTQRSQAHSNNAVPTPSVARHGSTTPLTPFARVRSLARTPRFSRRSHRST